MGGGTPLQLNIYPEGEVHHLNGILIHRGEGGYTTSVEYLSQPPIFPNAPFSTLFFFSGGVFPCVAWTLIPISIFMTVFFVVGGCVEGGGVPDFFLSLSERKEGREGAGAGTTLLSDFC